MEMTKDTSSQVSMTCHQCKSSAGQVMRKESDFFDCLECGAFTYVKGINTTSPALQNALKRITEADTLQEAARLARVALATA